jgi:hypothetical protein
MPVDIDVTTNAANEIVLSPDNDNEIKTDDGIVTWRVDPASNIERLDVTHDNGPAPDPPTPSAPTGGATTTSLSGSVIGSNEDVVLDAFLIGGSSINRTVKVIRV